MRTLLLILWSSLSGLLLWTAFFPFDFGPAAFVTLAPLLTLVRAEGIGKWKRFAVGYCGGLAFFLLALQWIPVAHPAMYYSYFGMTFVCSLFWPIAIGILRQLDRWNNPLLCLTVPVVWVALEYFRAHFPTGFPFLKWIHLHQYAGFGWYALGYSQHGFNLLIQMADVGGVYLISAGVAAVNGAVAEWLLRIPAIRKLLQLPVVFAPGYAREFQASAIAIFGLVVLLSYGLLRSQHPPFANGPRVTAIQADIEQGDKMTDLEGLFDRYNGLCVRNAPQSDLVIWPETCYPFGWWSILPGQDGSASSDVKDSVTTSRAMVKAYASGELDDLPDRLKRAFTLERVTPWKTNVLLGLNGYEWDGKREGPTNTALLIDRDGAVQGRYDKMHLVPFGEYVPFRQTFPWLQRFTPYPHDYSCRPGEAFTRFPLPVGDKSYSFGVLICYEDTDPLLARRYVVPEGEEKPVDFLVNISNDGWFKGTEEHEGHLAICRFRAIETRRSVVRAVNMGISALIDPDGKVIRTPADTWARSKQMDGVVSEKVPLDTRGSYYAELGDWVPGLCWGIIITGWIVARLRRNRT